MKRISIIIPSYNSYRTIGRTLESLFNQEGLESGLEVIIVDSSDDGVTKDILTRQRSANFQVIHAEKKLGPADARNLGAHLTRGEILVFIDSDVYPAVDFVHKILNAFREGYLIGGGAIDIPDSQRTKPIPLAQYFLQFSEYTPSNINRVVKFIPSCNLWCDKNLFKNIGGFPEIRASEDVLFGLKASQYSNVWFIPDIRVFHIFREDWSSFLKNQVLLGKYVCIYRRKQYSSEWYYKGIMPLLFLPAFIVIKFLMITGRILRSDFFYISRYIVSLPVFLIGLFAWGIGFAKGVFSDEA